MITPDQLTPALVAWMLNPDGTSDDYSFDDFDPAQFGHLAEEWVNVQFSAVRSGANIRVIVIVPEADDGDDVEKTFRITVTEVPT